MADEPKQLYGRMTGSKGPAKLNPEFAARNAMRDRMVDKTGEYYKGLSKSTRSALKENLGKNYEVGKILSPDMRKLNNPAVNRLMAKRAVGRAAGAIAAPAAVAAASYGAATEGFDRMERDINPIRQAAADVVSRSVVRGKERQSEQLARQESARASTRKPARNGGR
jgi:hypothetical protein